ncbi:MAG: mandelate racemase/muconate lactonizing enzyme family protein [Chloroflexi bacterium]|nr:mandelate racemase/muconate lactonizing enzyme family protein [Chloroflexota bacterium]MCY3938779.1 mandelate racemase/muconate lactonizing enzyme family protein [Chloroflexota bacterium]
MKITDITLESYEWPRPKPIRNGMFVYYNVRLDIVTVHTDEGLKGVGIGSGAPGWDAVIESLKPGVVGQDPINVERIWHQLWVPKLTGRRGYETRVISAIDIAIWDLIGKITDQPVYKLLGGFADRIDVYIAGGYYEEGKGLAELADEMESNLELGARAVKMKIGGESMSVDVERVKTAREAIGPDIKLMVDANNAYRHHEAIAIAKRIEEYDIFWFEEPCGADDYDGHARVVAATSIPIATGENEYTRYGFRDLIQHRAASILQPDANIMGGVTEFRKVADLAAAYDLAVSPHGSQDVHIHLVTGTPTGLILEYYRDTVDPMWDTKFKETLRLDADGMLAPPDRPGFGFEPNYEALERHRIA